MPLYLYFTLLAWKWRLGCLQVGLVLAGDVLLDDECREADCALSALQVRGKRLASEEAESRSKQAPAVGKIRLKFSSSLRSIGKEASDRVMSLPASDETGHAEQNLDLHGVSCHHLKNDLMDCIRSHGQELSSVSVHGIEPLIRARGQDVMCPKTGKLGSSYVDALQGEDHVGMSNFMLSYSWRYSVTDIVTSLVHHCQNWGREELRTYFWICCFCINQHRVKEAQDQGVNVPFEEFREAFELRVRGVGHVLALMAPWDQPVYVSRVWCVFEVFTAVNDAHCELTVILPPKEMDRFCLSISRGALDRYLWSSLEQLDVQTAEASVAADKDNILRIVAQGVGFDYLNQMVRQQLLRWLAESASREALQQFSTGDLFGDTAAEIGAQISGFLHRLGHYEKAHQLLTKARAAASSDSEEKANLLRSLAESGAPEMKVSGMCNADPW
eukprot:s246_g41.t1